MSVFNVIQKGKCFYVKVGFRNWIMHANALKLGFLA